MKGIKVAFIIGMVVSVFFIGALGTGHAGSGGGVLNKFKFVSAEDSQQHSTTTWINMPDMTKTFNTKKRGRMVITLSAEVNAEGGPMYVKVQIDGVDLEPKESRLTGSTSGEGYRSHSFTWVTEKIAPGQHTVNVLWQSTVLDDLKVRDRTLLIQYKG